MNANTPDGPTHLHQFDIDHINAYDYRRDPAPHEPERAAGPAAGPPVARHRGLDRGGAARRDPGRDGRLGRRRRARPDRRGGARDGSSGAATAIRCTTRRPPRGRGRPRRRAAAGASGQPDARDPAVRRPVVDRRSAGLGRERVLPPEQGNLRPRVGPVAVTRSVRSRRTTAS